MNKLIKPIILLLSLVFAMFLQQNFFINRPFLHLFPNSFEKINGVIIDEKNAMRRGHITGEFTYSYQFYFDGTNYKNDSERRYYKIGDSVIIHYNKYFPSINQIKNSPKTRDEYLRMSNNK